MNLLLNPSIQTPINSDITTVQPSLSLPLPVTQCRVLILSSLTGWGHKRVAEALKQAFYIHPDKNIEVIVHIENVLEKSNVVNQALSGLYNWFLRHAQPWMFLYYHLINVVHLSHQAILLEPMTPYAQRLYDEHQPDVLISVHPMMQYFGGILQRIHAKKTRKALPLFTVVSDPCYGFWKDWVRSNVTHYFTATTGSSDQLKAYGVESSQMSELGLPLLPHVRQWTDAEKNALRLVVWGNTASRLTLFFNAGWAGGGTIEELLKVFLKSALATRVNIIFQTGANVKLQKRMAQLIAQHPEKQIFLATSENEMNVLYALADAIVTKPGAATVFESLHHGVPLLIDAQKRLMPQEVGTAKWLASQEAGICLKNPDALIEHIAQWLAFPNERHAMSLQAKGLASQASAERLCRDILKRLF